MYTPRSSAAKDATSPDGTPVSSLISPDIIVWDKKTSSPVLSAIRPSNDRRDFLSLFASSPSHNNNGGASPVSTRSPHLTLPSLRRGPSNHKPRTSRHKATSEIADMKALLESPQSDGSPTPVKKNERRVATVAATGQFLTAMVPSGGHDEFLTAMMPLEDDDELGQFMDNFEASQQQTTAARTGRLLDDFDDDDDDDDDFDEELLCRACDDAERTVYAKQ